MRVEPVISGTTRVAAVIGDPVSHSRSPAILNAAFREAGLDWVFAAFAVAEGAAREAVAAMRTLGLVGMSVTMPHKAAVSEFVDDLTAPARRLGAVNCISWDDGNLVGHNTDGTGLLASLRADGVDPASRRAVVLGAGGAARAAVLALADAGARSVAIWNRTGRRALEAAELCEVATVVGGSAEGRELRDAVADAEILVNATSVGMGGTDLSPVPAEVLHPSLFVSELIYQPRRTRLMQDATAVGARTSNGIGMLVGQAAAAFGIWSGLEAPMDAMRAAALGSDGAEN